MSAKAGCFCFDGTCPQLSAHPSGPDALSQEATQPKVITLDEECTTWSHRLPWNGLPPPALLKFPTRPCIIIHLYDVVPTVVVPPSLPQPFGPTYSELLCAPHQTKYPEPPFMCKNKVHDVKARTERLFRNDMHTRAYRAVIDERCLSVVRSRLPEGDERVGFQMRKISKMYHDLSEDTRADAVEYSRLFPTRAPTYGWVQSRAFPCTMNNSWSPLDSELFPDVD